MFNGILWKKLFNKMNRIEISKTKYLKDIINNRLMKNVNVKFNNINYHVTQ